MRIDINDNPNESERLDSLLNEVYAILEKKDLSPTNESKIDEALEKIILLRSNRAEEINVFEEVWEMSASMIEGNFSKRIKLPASLMGENNIFNFIATTWNTTSDEQKTRLLSKELSNDVIELISAEVMVIVTDKTGVITYCNRKFQHAFKCDPKQLYIKKIQDFIPETISPIITIEFCQGKKEINIKGKKAFLTVSPTSSTKTASYIYIIRPCEQQAFQQPLSISPKSEKRLQELEGLINEFQQLYTLPLELGETLSEEEASVLKHQLFNEGNTNNTSNTADDNSDQIYHDALKKLNNTLYKYDNWVLEKARELQKKNKKGDFGNFSAIPVNAKVIAPQHTNIQDLLKIYQDQWKDWVNLGAALSIKEELCLQYFLDYRSHDILAEKLKTSASSINFTYNSAVKKIKFSLQRYNSWILSRALDISRQHTYENGNSTAFLNTPLKKLKLPIKIIHSLEIMGVNTPLELCKQVNMNELYKLRGIGENSVQAIIKIFKQNNCEHLLRFENR